MKNNDLLLYGAIAVGAYLLFFKKPVSAMPVPQTSPLLTKPVNTPLLSQSAVNPGNALTNLINSVVKAVNPSTPATVPNQTIQVSSGQVQANNDAIQQSVDNIFTPTSSALLQPPVSFITPPYVPVSQTLADQTPPPVFDDSQYLMFQNGDYPGAITGLNQSFASKYNEY
jgi:hypothetical protein